MYRDQLLPIVVSVGLREGRCHFCRARILWATVASRKGRKAKTLPFDLPKPFPMRTDRDADTGITVEWWPEASLHFTSCTNRPQATRAKTEERLRTASRDGQGRLL